MLTIDNKILEWANISEKQLLEEVAIMLYKKEKLTFCQAAKSANLSYSDFQELLGQKEIAVNYDEEMLIEDMETIKWMNNH
jgi:predicted HTH domain antitoxin